MAWYLIKRRDKSAFTITFNMFYYVLKTIMYTIKKQRYTLQYCRTLTFVGNSVTAERQSGGNYKTLCKLHYNNIDNRTLSNYFVNMCRSQEP